MTAQNRIQRYLDMREAKPMPQLGDGIHSVNPGTEFEGTLSLSDLRELSSQYREMLEALIMALPYIETAELDEGYKPGVVAKVAKAMRAAIDSAEGRS